MNDKTLQLSILLLVGFISVVAILSIVIWGFPSEPLIM